MQVLLCLQSNALKFTKDGEVEIIVEVEDEYLNVSVRDSGIGISEENQSKLFKLFGFLKDSQQMNKNGVGLGLVISKQICQ
jgi:signal transduction histidine kinase